MNQQVYSESHHGWPRWWKMLVIGLATISLCSCRPVQTPSDLHAPAPYSTLPPQAWTGGPGMPGSGPPVAPTAHLGIPLPQMTVTPWAPPGIELPWPKDEYLHDGGDQTPEVIVGPDWEVRGLQLEDTVMHYDTIDGRTIVKPSNRVHLYAPRFNAVRKVEAVELALQSDQSIQVALPVQAILHEEQRLATTAVQPVQPIGDIGIKQPSIARLKQSEGRVSAQLLPEATIGREKPFEDFQVVRIGIEEDSEKARLAESIQAAIVWSHDKAVQVILDNQIAAVVTGDQRAQATYRIDVPNNPCLRVIKVASTQVAKPGEIVDFTIRFDNIGDQVIGNVTLLDNLTTRLEYVVDSAQSSREAEFFVQPNEGDSLVLRWEFTEPLPAGAGGVVRFQCRVR